MGVRCAAESRPFVRRVQSDTSGTSGRFVELELDRPVHSCWRNCQRCTVAGRRMHTAAHGGGSGRAVRRRHARCNGACSDPCERRASNRRRDRTGGSHGQGVCVVRCGHACPGRHIGADESCAVPGLSRGSQDGAVLERASNGRTLAAVALNRGERGAARPGAPRRPARPLPPPFRSPQPFNSSFAIARIWISSVPA